MRPTIDNFPEILGRDVNNLELWAAAKLSAIGVEVVAPDGRLIPVSIEEAVPGIPKLLIKFNWGRADLAIMQAKDSRGTMPEFRAPAQPVLDIGRSPPPGAGSNGGSNMGLRFDEKLAELGKQKRSKASSAAQPASSTSMDPP